MLLRSARFSSAFALCASVLYGALTPSGVLAQTSLAPPQATPESNSAAPRLGVPSGENFRVNWQNPTLAIYANGADLNEVLQQVSRLTGMTIAGMVPSQRIFGTYGPGPAERVLGSLLDGLGVNVMIVNRDQTVPSQLTISQRNGPPSPPEPQAPEPPVQQYMPVQQPVVPQRPFSRPPNGIHTPQEIQAELEAHHVHTGANGANANAGTDSVPASTVTNNPSNPVSATSFGAPVPTRIPPANSPGTGSGPNTTGVPPQE